MKKVFTFDSKQPDYQVSANLCSKRCVHPQMARVLEWQNSKNIQLSFLAKSTVFILEFCTCI